MDVMSCGPNVEMLKVSSDCPTPEALPVPGSDPDVDFHLHLFWHNNSLSHLNKSPSLQTPHLTCKRCLMMLGIENYVKHRFHALLHHIYIATLPWPDLQNQIHRPPRRTELLTTRTQTIVGIHDFYGGKIADQIMEFLASVRPGIQASPSGGEQNLLCCAAPGLEISRDCDTDIIFSDLIWGRGDIKHKINKFIHWPHCSCCHNAS